MTETLSTPRNFSIGSSGGSFEPALGTTLTLSGTVTCSGGGMLTLGGSGTTLLSDLVFTEACNFKVNGNLGSAITIPENVTLSGTGTTSSITCQGTIAPGNSVGTLSSGSVVFEDGSIFQVEIDPSAASLLNVTGSAALNGTLQVVQDAGTYASSGQYVIIQTTEGITGSFAPTVLGGLRGFSFSWDQVGDDLYLIYSSAFSISLNGLSGNVLKVANYLNQYGTSEGLNFLLDLSSTALEDALISISPSRNAFGSYVANQNAFSLSNLTCSHIDHLRSIGKVLPKNKYVAALLADASGEIPTRTTPQKNNRYSIWASGFANFAHQDGSNQNPSFNFISEYSE